jgi:hypothetical protein
MATYQVAALPKASHSEIETSAGQRTSHNSIAVNGLSVVDWNFLHEFKAINYT